MSEIGFFKDGPNDFLQSITRCADVRHQRSWISGECLECTFEDDVLVHNALYRVSSNLLVGIDA